MNPTAANSLCLQCGLCCNGVIFAHGQLQPSDDSLKLKSLGLRVSAPSSAANPPKFKQPCAAFQNSCCQIYSQRPQYCRQFECFLLKNVKAGALNQPDATRIIRSALRKVQRVERLLRLLGDAETTVPLRRRFRRAQKRMETNPFNRDQAGTFGELTLAVHDLNMLLSESFYHD